MSLSVNAAEYCYTDEAKTFHLFFKPTSTKNKVTTYSISGYAISNNKQYPTFGSAVKTNGIMSIQTISTNPIPFQAFWDSYTNSNTSYTSKEIVDNIYTIINPTFTKIPCE